MKVLFIQQGFGYGGATKSLIETQKALKDSVDIYTITKKNKRLNKILSYEFTNSKDIIELEIPGIFSYSEGISTIQEFNKAKEYFPKEIISYINENNIDVVHINSSVFSNLVKSIKENTKSKIVVHLREVFKFNGTNDVEKYIIEKTFKYSDAIIAISPNEISYYPKSEKIQVIANPHDFSLTDKYLDKKNTSINKVIIGMCANFNPIKGHLVFIEAIEQINKYFSADNLNLEFRIIGYPKKNSLNNFINRNFNKSSYLYQFHKKLKSKKIDNLTIVPFTLDVYYELSQLDIYVRPDISGNPWGRDIIEAMALKLPVIATGKSDFFIKNNVTGLLVKPSDSKIIIAKIIELIENEELRKQLGENAYVHIKELCKIDNYKVSLLNIYNKILSN